MLGQTFETPELLLSAVKNVPYCDRYVETATVTGVIYCAHALEANQASGCGNPPLKTKRAYRKGHHSTTSTSLIAQSTAQSTAPAAQRHDRMSTG